MYWFSRCRTLLKCGTPRPQELILNLVLLQGDRKGSPYEVADRCGTLYTI